MDSQFAALANITFVAAWTSITTGDIASNTYLQAPINSTLDSIDYKVSWSDPTDDMISMAHELTLRTAIATTNTSVVTLGNNNELETTPNLLTQYQPEILSPNLTLVNRTISQKAKVTMNFEETVYKAQPPWLVGAFAVIAIACLSIVPTYWGCWRLGRPVSMSPLEIAKAFDAPLMQHADPNGSAADHIKAVGDMRVRYGSHATIVEQSESDATERLSCPPRIDNTLNASVVEQGSGDETDTNRRFSALDTPMAASGGWDDDIELRVLTNPATTGRISISSDPPESTPETQADSSSVRPSSAELAPSRIHTRIEMRLKFAEE